LKSFNNSSPDLDLMKSFLVWGFWTNHLSTKALIVATFQILVCGSTHKTKRAIKSNGHHFSQSPPKFTPIFLAVFILNELSFTQLSFRRVYECGCPESLAYLTPKTSNTFNISS
jgi:hypothetical protein